MTRQNLREAGSRGLRQLSTSLFLALSVAIASFAATAQPAEVVVRVEVTDRSEETIAAAAREALQQTLLLQLTTLKPCQIYFLMKKVTKKDLEN